MRSLREGVYPNMSMTGKTAWLVEASAGAVTMSATVEGTLMVCCRVWRGAAVDEVVVVESRGSRDIVREWCRGSLERMLT